jgi:hypothetical protein
MICCESALVDGLTGLPSYINVFDTIRAFPTQPPLAQVRPDTPGSPLLSIRASAVWMLLEGESPEDQYEYEMTIQPPGHNERIVQNGVFRFEKRFFRFDMAILANPETLPLANGILWIASRIRHPGHDWISQSYPLVVEVFGQNPPPPE